jgi:hypothetical protein
MAEFAALLPPYTQVMGGRDAEICAGAGGWGDVLFTVGILERPRVAGAKCGCAAELYSLSPCGAPVPDRCDGGVAGPFAL